MSVDEHDIKKTIAEVEATRWRLRETIRARELAATHRLGQMRHLQMLEEQKAWKREAGFDVIETAAEMDARRSRTNLVSEHFFYSKMFNPRCPHTHEQLALEMRVDVEGLTMEIILSKPEPPPQYDASPRRLPAVDTGSEKPGTPRRSPAIGTGSDEPIVSRAQSTERKYFFPLQASVDGVDDNDEATTGPSQQAVAREEIARPTKKRQQQRMTAWTTEQSKQFDRGRSTAKPLLFYREKCLVAYTVCSFFLVSVCFLLLYIFCHVRNFSKQIRKAIGAIGMYQGRERLYQDRSVHRHLDLR